MFLVVETQANIWLELYDCLKCCFILESLILNPVLQNRCANKILLRLGLIENQYFTVKNK